ncbi:di-trans,poly-cis-decaprenylcistransferase [Aminithiophilus ramosus]|uniref:Isoprenyl transferase n=2 Tax=Synergistales TaxID=649776 RepID=A0A9Q7AFE1_9BACT|nr:polyprenyl diphosphate synthase [Aminithiophilus ramosus]QTX33588.1 di-trans,poly-cis-decaprenylcistransferase [Aminithiophilus ramosus]QVL37443.1 di-trans,poly-cis-decaprenylcistransferase [Synergistota bacterium]
MSEDIVRVPVHLAIIMDGNGRWAQKRGLPRIVGHKYGVQAVEKIVRAASNRGIRYISLYAFSTENWKRPKTEVLGLMSLFKYFIKIKINELKKESVRLRFSGRLEDLSPSILDILRNGEESTRMGTKIDMIVCLNYGGRQEILDAVSKYIASDIALPLNENIFRSFLYLPDVPDPDLIIRTSGELRLSNFLIWQSSYSEFYFTDKLWPDFDEKELDKALVSYNERDRRYGRT